MICPTCGYQNLPKDKFCQQCGLALPKTSRSKLPVVIIISFLFFTVILKTETLKDPLKDEKDDSSTQEDSSSDDDANVDSSDEQEVDQNAPKPVVANGQTTTWVSDDGPVLTINGTTTVTISNGSEVPEDGTYDIKGIENNGEQFYIARGPASMGEISIVDNVLTLNNQGQIITYHYQPQAKTDNTENSSYEDDDNIYEAD